ncbi:MAG: hypothetical protein OXI16_13550 [Chloroflexota bacterium]|nr:hypothetical protein [Chloroflexota bacterium]
MYDNNDDMFGDITEPFIQDGNNHDHIVAGSYLLDDDRPARPPRASSSVSSGDDGFFIIILIIVVIAIISATIHWLAEMYTYKVAPLIGDAVRLVSSLFG